MRVKLFAVFVWIVLIGCALHAQEAGAPPKIPIKDFTKATAHKILRVIDGDTAVLVIDGKETTVRLIGVDAPESVHPEKPVQHYGQEASRFLDNLLKGERAYVEYEAGPSRLDTHGRTLAYLFRAPDGLFVNLEIVRQGYGRAYTEFPFQHLDLFRHYERAARKAAKGLWSPQVPPPNAGPTTPPATPEPEVRRGPSPKEEVKEAVVYVTRTGTKYHRAGCRYLARSQMPIGLKEAKQRYGPCSVCRPTDR